MKSMDALHIVGPAIYTTDGVIPAGSLQVSDGVIQSIAADEIAVSAATPVLRFPAQYHVVPGFIDLHTHGAQGHDVMDATLEALLGISHALAAEGTTAFLATTMTADIASIEAALANVQQVMSSPTQSGAAILGVHLEGPFLAAAKMGAQPGDYIIAPDVSLVQRWQQQFAAVIRLMTLAPEQENSLALIRYLKEHNIIASIGHTNASYAEAMAAITAGATQATHLFNAMRGLHHREPGAVTAALLADSVNVELILDGFHLHPAIVEMVLRLKGKDKLLLITDAMRAKCLQDGCYDLGGQSVSVQAGQARLADGTLAGSVLAMPTAIQNMLRFTGCDLSDAVQMASENPAKALGIFQRKGSLSVGKDADFVVLDEAFSVVMTVRAGQIIYQASDLSLGK